MSARALMSAARVAAYLDISRPWARTLLADGTIPGARKIRGRWYVERAHVDAWVDAGRPEAEPVGVPYAPYPKVMTRTRGAADAA